MAEVTFLDSDVLFAGHRGEASLKAKALSVLNDKSRFFVASPFLRLETLPKAVYHRNVAEIEFYQTYFDNVRVWVGDVESIVSVADQESQRHGIAALDALHVAAAHLGEATILITLERPEKPMYRTSLVRVMNLLSL